MDANLLLILTYAARILAIIIFTLVFKVIKEYRLEKWVKILVNTAEQIYQEMDGTERMEWVRQEAAKKLNAKPEDVSIIAEAFVNEINMQKQKIRENTITVNEVITEPKTYYPDGIKNNY